MSQLSAVALSLIAAGYSVIPIQQSNKKPAVAAWLPYQSMPMDSRTAEREFMDGRQIAVITGSISGNLELLDFDTDEQGKCTHFGQWWATLKENGYEALLGKLTVATTPSGGRHVFYRCSSGVESNQPLAKQHKDKPPIIETRGEGGYALIYPSPGYVWKQGNLDTTPKLTAEEREILIHAATMFDEVPAKVEPPPRKAPRQDGVTYVGEIEPWRLYNQQTEMKDLLEREGWQYVGMIGKREKWRRPGKDRGEHSATITTIGDQVLYPFTTSTIFPSGKGLDCFGVYTWLKFAGDFSGATQAARKELGMPERTPIARATPGPVVVAQRKEGGKGLNVKSLESFEMQDPVFGIFGKYLLCGTINLLEAAGSVGKSTQVLKWVADASNGYDTYHEVDIEPYRCLYFAHEDTGGDIRAVYVDLKGNPGFLDVFDEPIDMRGENLKLLKETIIEGGYKLVVFDPLLRYMHGCGNINDPMAVNSYLSPIRTVAQETGACILNIRHFTKDVSLKDRKSRGSGTAQFRDSHRSQIVMDWHKEIPGLRVCTHERESIRTLNQPPFGWCREPRTGAFQWYFDVDILEAGK